MARYSDLLLTALAPTIWGSTYFVTTEFLPSGYPMTVALLRALPAGILLLLLVRQLPWGIWWGRSLLLGALNFAFFWAMLFIAAYRLPGGVAATVGAVQPLIVIVLARGLLGSTVPPLAVATAAAGVVGVALIVLKPNATLGTVLSRRWHPPVSSLTFTAWQLTAGGMLLLPIALWAEPPLPALDQSNILGLAYLGLIGAAFTYILWFRGLSRLEPHVVAPLGFFSPITAVVLGWVQLGQTLTPYQLIGMLIALGSVWLSGRTQTSERPRPDAPGRAV